MSERIDVTPAGEENAVRRFTVGVGGRTYDVGVAGPDLERLGGGCSAEELVRESFRFLLERESPASIMRRFDLPVIARYFPEYPEEIQRRVAG